MFYSIALHTVSSADQPDEATKAKLRSNLWLAFNDARLLLEPSMTGIQALLMMVRYAEGYMTPSICWSLVSKACLMLQGMGINGRGRWRHDLETRKRRTRLFWLLNVMDNWLAIILGRPPTFQRGVAQEVELPGLEQLLPSQRTQASKGAPMLFVAHYTHQMHLLSRIMLDIWHCLHGQDFDGAPAVRENLECWYRQATEVVKFCHLEVDEGTAADDEICRFLKLLRS